MIHDVIVLGGGPAGSTAATLLSQQGFDCVVVEKDHFPRFHIGESLLPATVRIFERLGVHEQIRDVFIRKPGGKWLYGDIAVPGDFAKPDRHATFRDCPYSYLVERSVFDKILIDRSIDGGADVRFGTEVVDVLTAERADESHASAAPKKNSHGVAGVRCRTESGKEYDLRARLVIDASGLRSLIPSKLRLRKLTEPHRMGIYAQYAASPTRDDVKAGWFIGQMFYDGWTWLLRLPGNRFSVGVVLTVDRFRKSGLSPTELLERMVEENPLLNDGMTIDRKRISDVMVTGNMGNSSESLAGDGWVAVGDAAYFIDPCYSSGVHLAMKSAEMVADLVAGHARDTPITPALFDQYQKDMRQHEKSVQRMVDTFYIASRNTSVQKMVTSLQGGYFSRKFVTFVGGDFDRNSSYIARIKLYSNCAAVMFGNDAKRAPANSPNYLHKVPSSDDESRIDADRHESEQFSTV
ncbi:NAD(P)/FAD-dependent oxidoreductase [Fuerstiella marisgermanici]|uniref:2,4-dichlorophenol 6-monooxygenase n=1 Tax=Fuerstiella marisgermanici TaxID=1891926 RepID=A0A1P8WHM6_9PLAN|nr:NAD(P)/FAD-dependent oxidoreductase [Fuerstiella marisgermanici]APZ93555.1 2,4-dichlorophenol 6-monooxygenase [Fuerstiella marisgermanici]